MQFEKIRRINKNKIIIGGLITLGILGAITILPSFAKYRVTDSIKIGEGVVNYKVPDFKVMAIYKSEDGTNYAEITDRMPSSGYVINESKSYCTLDNTNKDTAAKLYTANGNHIFENLAKSDKCYLYFDKVKNISNIIASNKINIGSPDFSKVAITDEGIYAIYDNVYGNQSYYWRGATTTNYVKFANFCWRIVRINGDGSIRLIYDGTTCHANGQSTAESIAKTSIQYNASYNNSSYVGWTYSTGTQRTLSGTASNAKSQLESWYSSNITGTNASKVADGKFCNDRNVQSGQTWVATGTAFNYAEYQRLYTNYQPTLSCNSGDVYTLKVGLITADEVELAGGKNENNTQYYLYNGQAYWTMSPCYWTSSYAGVFLVNANGHLAYAYVSNSYGLRPVINLKADTTFSGGDGTQSNPYIVKN